MRSWRICRPIHVLLSAAAAVATLNSCATMHAPPPPAPAWAPAAARFSASNAYRDTVWFQTPFLRRGSLLSYQDLHGGTWRRPIRSSVEILGRTSAFPLLIVAEVDSTRRREDVLRSVITGGPVCRECGRVRFRDTENRREYAIQAGSFDFLYGARMYVWSVEFDSSETRPRRLTIVTFGVRDTIAARSPLRYEGQEPDARFRGEGDPAPILLTHHPHRVHDVPPDDRLTTLRLVGEFEVDPVMLTIRTLPLKPLDRKALLARP